VVVVVVEDPSDVLEDDWEVVVPVPVKVGKGSLGLLGRLIPARARIMRWSGVRLLKDMIF